jgi:hypothetical protein
MGGIFLRGYLVDVREERGWLILMTPTFKAAYATMNPMRSFSLDRLASGSQYDIKGYHT